MIETPEEVVAAADRIVARYPATIPSDDKNLRTWVAQVLFSRHVDPTELIARLGTSWELIRALTEEVGVGFQRYQRDFDGHTQYFVDWSDWPELRNVASTRIADALERLAMNSDKDTSQGSG